jgi:hypothetical protein
MEFTPKKKAKFILNFDRVYSSIGTRSPSMCVWPSSTVSLQLKKRNCIQRRVSLENDDFSFRDNFQAIEKQISSIKPLHESMKRKLEPSRILIKMFTLPSNIDETELKVDDEAEYILPSKLPDVFRNLYKIITKSFILCKTALIVCPDTSKHYIEIKINQLIKHSLAFKNSEIVLIGVKCHENQKDSKGFVITYKPCSLSSEKKYLKLLITSKQRFLSGLLKSFNKLTSEQAFEDELLKFHTSKILKGFLKVKVVLSNFDFESPNKKVVSRVRVSEFKLQKL